MPQQILNAVVHKMKKATSADATLVLATVALNREDEALHALVEQVLSAAFRKSVNAGSLKVVDFLRRSSSTAFI